MAARELPERELILKVLSYEPSTGEFRWRRRDCPAWNGKFGDRLAGCVNKVHGYSLIVIQGVQYPAHRIAWFLTTGEQPEEIDHINGDRADNRIRNLRAVTGLENRRNKALQANNRSGIPGVRLKRGRWVAEIKHEGQIRHIGQYDTIEEASIARKAVERILGYHPNHGRAALRS